jgi:hypothetical protein
MLASMKRAWCFGNPFNSGTDKFTLSYQSGEAPTCHAGLRLAVQQFPPLCEGRFVTGRLERRHGRDPGPIRRVIDRSGRPRAQNRPEAVPGSTASRAILRTLRWCQMPESGHSRPSRESPIAMACSILPKSEERVTPHCICSWLAPITCRLCASACSSVSESPMLCPRRDQKRDRKLLDSGRSNRSSKSRTQA